MKPNRPVRGFTLDAGALIALERNEARVWARLKEAVRQTVRPVIPAPVLAQVWRSAQQANLARAIKQCRVEVTDNELARAAGELLAATGTDDAIDAIVIAGAARRGDIVVTSDVDDLGRLAAHVKGVTLAAT